VCRYQNSGKTAAIHIVDGCPQAMFSKGNIITKLAEASCGLIMAFKGISARIN